MTTGFAAHILFMRPVKLEGGKYFGESRGIHYPINDDQAAVYETCWVGASVDEVVHAVLSNKTLWDTDLTRLEGFEAAVITELTQLMEKGGI